MLKRIVASLGLLALLLAVTASSGSAATSTSTAQGIMVNLHAEGTYAIVQENTYKFNKAEAASYYTNAWDGNAPIYGGCTGPGCGHEAVPSSPTAPAADPTELTGSVAPAKNGWVDKQSQQCEGFLNGGSLSGTTYTQKIQITDTVTWTDPKTGKLKSGSATYTWTFGYAITPIVGSVEPLTAWELVSSVGGETAHIEVGGEIAGESVVKNKQNGQKYSFSLQEGTNVETNRVQNLSLSVKNTSEEVVATANPGSTVNFPVSFGYETNAGSNGTTSMLLNGNDMDILNGVFPSPDTFLGNNNGGADGSAAALASMEAVAFDLPAGTYTVSFTGVVKDNVGTANLPFAVTQIIHIITPGCGA